MSAADDVALAPWMCRTAEPTTAPSPRAVSIDGLTLAQVRESWFDLHHRLNVSELECSALRRSCEVFERAHRIAVEQLIAKSDECDALREAVGMAENVIATLRARVATLESLAAGPRLVIDEPVVDAIDGGAPRRVPMPCVDCRGDGVVNDAECGACGGEGCRS